MNTIWILLIIVLVAAVGVAFLISWAAGTAEKDDQENNRINDYES